MTAISKKATSQKTVEPKATRQKAVEQEPEEETEETNEPLIDSGAFFYDNANTTPIVTVASNAVTLINDGAGVLTDISNAPDTVSDVLTNNAYDFSDLSVDDDIEMTVDLAVNSLTPVSGTVELVSGEARQEIGTFTESAGQSAVSLYREFTASAPLIGNLGLLVITTGVAASVIVNSVLIGITRRLL